MRLALMLAALAAAALGGCNKKKAQNVPDTPPPPPVAAAPPEKVSSFGDKPTNPNQGGNLTVGGGQGAIQAPRMAAARTVNNAQMKDLHLSMFQTWTLDNRVPTADEVMQAARQNSQLLPLLKEDVIILTNTTSGEGVWAYTAYPQRAGEHYVIVGSGVVQMSPDELKKRLEQQKSPVKLPELRAAPKTSGALDPRPAPAPVPAAPPAAPTVAVGQKDMEDVRIYIDNASGASGRMPAPKEVYDALVLTKSPAAGLVEKKAIVLTGAATRDSVWAFETTALTRGGLVASPNGVETVTAVELNRRLKASR